MKRDFQPVIRNGAGTAVAMLALSCVIGFAYNHASPLGVRRSASVESGPAPKRIASAALVSNVKTGYQNQTVAISFAPIAVAASPQPNAAAAEPATRPHAPAGRHTFANLTWPETKALLDSGKIVLIDARTATAFETERIPGAVSLPAGTPALAVTTFLNRYPKETQFVVYCGSATCGMSHMLADALVDAGWNAPQIRIMPGGFVEYRKAQVQPAGAAQ